MAMRERYGARRRFPMRPVLPVIVVVCDDTRTAVAYFTVLKHAVRERRIVHVHAAPRTGATARDVITFARSRAPHDPEPSDHVFVLVDLDTNPNEAELRREAAESSIEVLFSNPCFEVWTLAHLQCTGEFFLNCGAVVTRIKEKWRQQFGSEFGNKAQADYQKLIDLVDSGIACWESRSAATSQSWTEVWRAVKAIIS